MPSLSGALAAVAPVAGLGGGLVAAELLFWLAVSTLASEDAACIAAGLLVAQGRVGLLGASAACAVGILGGDLAIYAAGRFLGRPWLERAPLRWMVSPHALARGGAWFARRGPAVILICRFVPGTRVAAYLSAGLLGAGFWKLLAYSVIAVTLWTPLLVGLSAWLGERLARTFDAFSAWALPGAVAIALALTAAVRLVRRLSSWKGRRRLLGAFRRAVEWEFWPWWCLYLPVVPSIAWWGLRFRGPTLFTAANPGIEAGGFVGESKAAILGALDPRHVARFRKIEAGGSAAERLERAREFLARERIGFPLVVKPDVGQRGAGFTIVADGGELEAALGEAEQALLIQEYVGGVELGVFYVRRPSAARGRIFSITDKRMPRLEGDGRSTVEELILADERAMRMAPVHLDRMAGELERVPAAGEEVPLVVMGVHSRGALFLDGSRLATPELERAVDEIGRSFDGFFFGRFDLRAPSYDAFRRGEGLRVLELNGVTSEATHIYDPGNSFLDALRVLRRQWRLAFEIGAENRARGVRPASLAEVARLALGFLAGG